jgi:hypothetical protein
VRKEGAVWSDRWFGDDLKEFRDIKKNTDNKDVMIKQNCMSLEKLFQARNMC